MYISMWNNITRVTYVDMEKVILIKHISRKMYNLSPTGILSVFLPSILQTRDKSKLNNIISNEKYFYLTYNKPNRTRIAKSQCNFILCYLTGFSSLFSSNLLIN